MLVLAYRTMKWKAIFIAPTPARCHHTASNTFIKPISIRRVTFVQPFVVSVFIWVVQTNPKRHRCKRFHHGGHILFFFFVIKCHQRSAFHIFAWRFSISPASCIFVKFVAAWAKLDPVFGAQNRVFVNCNFYKLIPSKISFKNDWVTKSLKTLKTKRTNQFDSDLLPCWWFKHGSTEKIISSIPKSQEPQKLSEKVTLSVI